MLKRSSKWALERLIVLFSSVIECNGKDWKEVFKRVNDIRRSYASCYGAGQNDFDFKTYTISECRDQFSRVVNNYTKIFKEIVDYQTAKDEFLRHLLDDLVLRHLEELIGKSIPSSQEYNDVHIAVDWTLAKYSDPLFGLLKWTQFRAAHSNLFNWTRIKNSTTIDGTAFSSSSSSHSTEKKTDDSVVLLPAVKRLLLATKYSTSQASRAENAINRIIVKLLIWDSQWAENHEEIEQVAEKIFQNISNREARELASKTDTEEIEIDLNDLFSVTDNQKHDPNNADSTQPANERSQQEAGKLSKSAIDEQLDEPSKLAPSYEVKLRRRYSMFEPTNQHQLRAVPIMQLPAVTRTLRSQSSTDSQMVRVNQPNTPKSTNLNHTNPVETNSSDHHVESRTSTADTTSVEKSSIEVNVEKKEIPSRSIIKTRRQTRLSLPFDACLPLFNNVPPITDFNNNEVKLPNYLRICSLPINASASTEKKLELIREVDTNTLVTTSRHMTRSRLAKNGSGRAIGVDNSEKSEILLNGLTPPRRRTKRRLSYPHVQIQSSFAAAIHHDAVAEPREELDSSPEIKLKIRKKNSNATTSQQQEHSQQSQPQPEPDKDEDQKPQLVSPRISLESTKSLPEINKQKLDFSKPLSTRDSPFPVAMKKRIKMRKRLLIRPAKFELAYTSISHLGFIFLNASKEFKKLVGRMKKQKIQVIPETTSSEMAHENSPIEPTSTIELRSHAESSQVEVVAEVAKESKRVEARRGAASKRKAACLERSPILVSNHEASCFDPIDSETANVVADLEPSLVDQEPMVVDHLSVSVASDNRKSLTSRRPKSQSPEMSRKTGILLRHVEELALLKHNHLSSSAIERKPSLRRMINLRPISDRIRSGEITSMIELKHAFMRFFTDIVMKTPTGSHENQIAILIYKNGLTFIESKMTTLDENDQNQNASVVEPARKRSRLSISAR